MTIIVTGGAGFIGSNFIFHMLEVHPDYRIEGLCVITLSVHGDGCGYFMEIYSERNMEEVGFNIVFVQGNQSMSTKGVLRGLYFQKHYPQTKLARVVNGSVYDVAVNLRPDSLTYGQWHGEILSEENKIQLLIFHFVHLHKHFMNIC